MIFKGNAFTARILTIQLSSGPPFYNCNLQWANDQQRLTPHGGRSLRKFWSSFVCQFPLPQPSWHSDLRLELLRHTRRHCKIQVQNLFRISRKGGWWHGTSRTKSFYHIQNRENRFPPVLKFFYQKYDISSVQTVWSLLVHLILAVSTSQHEN